MIRFKCPKCAQTIKVKPSAAGKKGKCPGCGQSLRVPQVEGDQSGSSVPQPVQPDATEVVQPPPVPQHVDVPEQHDEPDFIDEFDEPTVPAVVPAIRTRRRPARRDYDDGYDDEPSPSVVHVTQIQQPSGSSNSLGIASMVLGILSLFVCWLPVVAYVFSGLGLLLAGIGFLASLGRKGSGIGYAIAGAAISSVNFLILLATVVFGIAILGGINQAVEQAEERQNARQQAEAALNAEDPAPADDAAADDDPADDEMGQQPEANAEPQWHPADSPVVLDGVSVQITDVVVGHVPLVREFTGTAAESENPALLIRLKITNLTDARKIDYRSWMSNTISFGRPVETLDDDNGNSYKGIRYRSVSVQGAESSGSIYPESSHEDAVVFEPPIKGVRFLRLELSANAFEGEGAFRFEIPAEMIRYTGEQ